MVYGNNPVIFSVGFCGSGAEEGLGWVVLALGLSDRWLEVQGAGVARQFCFSFSPFSLRVSLCGEFTWRVWVSGQSD